jgi:hypothetical protein
MSENRLTDARLARDLRALVPQTAPSGLQERIQAEVEMTAQQRRMPGPLARLTDVDPVVRRRAWLLVAAAMLAAALAVTGVVGALLTDRSTPVIPQLSLQQPGDMPVFAQSAYEHMPRLPPMTITALEDGTSKRRILVDGNGSVRVEEYATVDATEPESYTLYVGTTVAEVIEVDGRPAWHQQGDSLSEDPRVFVFAAMSGAGNTPSVPGCEIAMSPGETYADTPSRNWRWLGPATVAGRAAHHIACVGELWIDAETRVTLKSRGPMLDAAYQPIPGSSRTVEAIEIVFGEPPADLFELRPPDGVATIDDTTYSCAMDPYCTAPPQPVETPPPASGEVRPPADIDALVAASLAALDDPPAFDATVTYWNSKYPGTTTTRVVHDGDGRYRSEQTFEQSSDPPSIALSGEDYYYTTELTTDGVLFWRDLSGQRERGGLGFPLRVPDGCAAGWTFVGVDDIHGRPADHLTCPGVIAPDEYWIDRETRLVLRMQTLPEEQQGTTVEEVTDLRLGQQPAELFDLPPGADPQP